MPLTGTATFTRSSAAAIQNVAAPPPLIPVTPIRAGSSRFLISEAVRGEGAYLRDKNGVRFMLDSEDVMRSFREDWTRQTGNQIGLALECASPAEVDETYARVTEAGFHGEKEPWDAFWGQRYAVLLDPDAVEVSLYATLETS